MATISKRPTGKWQAQIRRYGHPPRSKCFPTKAQATYWARMVEHEMDTGTYHRPVETPFITLDECLARYEREITPTKKGAKREYARIDALRREYFDFCSMKLIDIKRKDIVLYRDVRLKQVSGSTVRKELSLLSHVFMVAIKEWEIDMPANPVNNIRMPDKGKPRDRRLSPSEWQRLAPELQKSPQLYELVVLAIETGMRFSELHTLTQEQVFLSRSLVHLPDTKNGRIRNVPLSSTAREVIAGLKPDERGRLFHGTVSYFDKRWRKACRAVEIHGLRFHDLRHEAISRFFEKGLDIAEVMSISGHRSVEMLLRYTHLQPHKLAQKLG